jgi:hypothetical protein
LGELEGEREVVGRYLDAVDLVLFGGPTMSKDGNTKRGWDGVKTKTEFARRKSLGYKGEGDTSHREGNILVPGAHPKELVQALESMRLGEDSTSQVCGVVAPTFAVAKDLHDLYEEDEEGEDNEVSDSELPDWARRDPLLPSIANDPLARAHALLVHLLPASLLHHLPLPSSPSSSDDEGEDRNDDEVDSAFSPVTPTQHNPSKQSVHPSRPPRNPARTTSASASTTTHPDSSANLTLKSRSSSTIPRIPFLQALSSGQLLCVAYNSALHRSKKPWGFINLESVHDVIGMEVETSGNGVHFDGYNKRRDSMGGHEDERDGDGLKRKVGWTFRRTDNLRLWTA